MKIFSKNFIQKMKGINCYKDPSWLGAVQIEMCSNEFIFEIYNGNFPTYGWW